MGKDVDNPTVANFKDPIACTSLMTEAGPVKVDMREIAKRIGRQIDKGDVISIAAYRDGHGNLKPMYDTIQIERRTTHHE